MTTSASNTLVFQDQAGDYFLVPQGVLERGRVPEEHTAELERLIATAAECEADGADARGYAGFFAGVAAVIVFRAGFDFGYALGNYLNSQVGSVAPNFDLSGGSGEPLPAPGGGHFYP